MTEAAWENRITGSGYEDPAQLLANPRNFRMHPEYQKAALNGVLNEIGWIQDVIVNTTTGHLIDGHLRVELAMQRGEKVPVKYVELSEHEEMIALASIDPISALATQDQDVLAGLIADIGTVEDDGLSAFLESLLGEPVLEEVEEEGLVDDDEVPEPQEEPVVKLGDVWILGDHRIACGDSTSINTVDQVMAGEQADMLWIDPPYNVNYEGSDGKKIANDNMDDGQFRQFLRDLFTSCTTAMKAGAPFYIAHADSEGYNFRGAAREAGLDVKQCLIWVKNSFVMGRQDHHWQHEPILYGWKPGAAHKWYGEFNKSTVLDEQPKVNDMDRSSLVNYVRELRNVLCTSVVRDDKPKANGDHPTMKPVSLITRQLRNSSRPGDIVIDFCGGSGSTLIAAEKTGRKARLIELSPTYAQVIVERWQEFTGRDAILEDTGQTFKQLAGE
ncbi:DNA modification methylase [Shewanella sp.]|uniref:DNA modification methylase n=1 Tax=Shewanella sp. TaxID=50422 RepID=UPI003F306A21